MAYEPSEDPLAVAARRHVEAAEANVARQEKLVAKLAEDPRHAALVIEAREVLDTFRYSLRLARDHLAIELRK